MQPFEQLILRKVEDLHEDVKQMKTRMLEGSPGQPSMAEEIAILKHIEASRRAQRDGIPSSFWKALGAVFLAIATLIGGYAGAKKLTQADDPPPKDVVVEWHTE